VLGSTSVQISQGDATALKIRGDADDLEKEPFFIKRNALVLGKSRSHRGAQFDELRFRVVIPDLQELKVKGSGSAYVKPFALLESDGGDAPTVQVEGSGDIKLYGIEGAAIELRVNGSGDIKVVKLDVAEVEAVVAGSGDLFIQNLRAERGEFVITGAGDIEVTEDSFVEQIEISVVGSGDADLSRVSCDRAEMNIVGSGNADIGEVREQLNASVLGSGDIRHGGDPEVES
ncbi:unnamed protein product, partial [Ectocarpus sp. 12 AP-2014]